MRFIADEKHTTIHGRTMFIDSIRYIDYSCSGAEFRFTGKKISAVLTSDVKADTPDIFLPQCAVLIDGEMTLRFELKEPEKEYVLFSSDEERTVDFQLIKMSEAAFGKVGIKEFITDSDIPPAPVPKSSRRIEFIGDSITCGYGIEGVVNIDQFNTRQENPYKAFASQTARRFGAEYHLVSWSGIGIYSSWVEDTVEEPNDGWLSPMIYLCTDAGLSNDLGRKPFDEWDFSQFVPHVIVINLGTNDQSFTKGIPEREQIFGDKYYDYLKLIREKNPESEIICSYGAMNDPLCETVRKTAEKFSADNNDSRIHYLRYTTHTDADGMGADFHPSQNTHDRMTDELTAKIKEVTGWDTV